MIACDGRTATRGLSVATALVVTLATTAAKAQAEDEAGARALFAEGRRLMKEGAYERACPKLEAASKLYPTSGILLNLGDCFEHENRLASAWTVFGDAALSAQRAGHAEDQAAEAKRRQAAVERRLQHVTVHVANDSPGLVVKRDGSVVNRGAWDTPLPVDAGEHTITAEAPGRTPWTNRVTVSQPGEAVTVAIPQLAIAEAVAPLPAPVDHPATAPSYWTGRRIAGVAMLGAGVGGVVIGGVIGLLAKSQYGTAEGETGAAQRNDSASAVRGGNAATSVMVAGGVVGAAGLVVWLTAPSATVTVGTTGRLVYARWTF